MRKYFIYQFKKRIFPIIVMAIMAALLMLVFSVDRRTSNVVMVVDVKFKTQLNSINSIHCVILCILCTILPVWDFSFLMNKRSVDGLLSLPIKRVTMFAVNMLISAMTIIGVFLLCRLVALPSLLAISSKEFSKHFATIEITYALATLFALSLYCTNSFIFSRANNEGDGLIFMIFYAFIGMLVTAFVCHLLETYNVSITASYFSYMSTYTPLITLFSDMGSEKKFGIAMCIVFTVLGVLSAVGLLLTAKYRKTENAEGISESWWGYKICLPLGTVCLTSLIASTEIALVLISIFALILHFVAKRTVKLPVKDWVVAFGSIALGIIIAIIFS